MTTEPKFTATKAHAAGAGAGVGGALAGLIIYFGGMDPEIEPMLTSLLVAGLPIVFGWIATWRAPANRMK